MSNRDSTVTHSSNLLPPPVTLAARNIRVEYTTRRRKYSIKRNNLLNFTGPRTTKEVNRAVKDVSLVAHQGESVGIVGRNGGGKSTLLRAIAGFDKRDGGQVYAASRPVFLGVSPALLPTRTGVENVRLGCLALGLTGDELTESIESAIELADIGEAIHDPINTYSAGMGARLRFAITASVPKTDILMIDEALGTGDAAFQEKSEQAMARILDSAGTIFFVSHATSQVKNLCTRVLWMHDGEIIMDGECQEVLDTYVLWSNRIKRRDFVATDNMITKARREYRAPEFTFSW